ncbi:GNAT family N-acetyltransferase [Stenotrophomonas sp. C3(2023)]|uniref:GNAT family N-acetyltransferase n=1 Tax=Stenotrophomonas sp. C3(2023) TaxID=3080277 RepID=UPI00293CDB08|nr:GNAT family N-acetyltransferase [Stenotrophomonas sp. C3(2023)]MDV3469849.1 GNAT family N-acetyltransferase [Stenotrophomonas sp. C3(2023)]
MALCFALLDKRLHDRDAFTCGVPVLDDYLRKRPSQHHRDGIATTHVLIDDGEPASVLGYCALSAAQLQFEDLNPGDRARLPAYPVPAIRMGRLAVSANAQGRGYGQLLVGHAVNVALAARQTLGVRVLIVDAKDEAAARFYMTYGFRLTSLNSMSLYLTISGS